MAPQKSKQPQLQVSLMPVSSGMFYSRTGSRTPTSDSSRSRPTWSPSNKMKDFFSPTQKSRGGNVWSEKEYYQNASPKGSILATAGDKGNEDCSAWRYRQAKENAGGATTSAGQNLMVSLPSLSSGVLLGDNDKYHCGVHDRHSDRLDANADPISQDDGAKPRGQNEHRDKLVECDRVFRKSQRNTPNRCSVSEESQSTNVLNDRYEVQHNAIVALTRTGSPYSETDAPSHCEEDYLSSTEIATHSDDDAITVTTSQAAELVFGNGVLRNSTITEEGEATKTNLSTSCEDDRMTMKTSSSSIEDVTLHRSDSTDTNTGRGPMAKISHVPANGYESKTSGNGVSSLTTNSATSVSSTMSEDERSAMYRTQRNKELPRNRINLSSCADHDVVSCSYGLSSQSSLPIGQKQKKQETGRKVPVPKRFDNPSKPLSKDCLRDFCEFQSRDNEDGPRISVTPMTKIPYVHGGYAAAAPIMLGDEKWMDILRRLMPESYASVVALLRHAAESVSKPSEITGGDKPALDPIRVMKWAENNPVVAAYGMLTSDAGQRKQTESTKNEEEHVPERDSRFSTKRRMRRKGWEKDEDKHYLPPTAPTQHQKSTRSSQGKPFQVKPALEWDVFLDPIIVRQVDKSLRKVEDLSKAGQKLENDMLVAAEVEVDRQVSRLLNRMILAHGSTTQLVAEAVGMAPRYNFSRVVEQGESTRRTQQRRRKSRAVSMTREKPIKQNDDDRRSCPSPSVVSVASVSHTEVMVAAAEADGVKGSKHAAATGIFVDRWLALFAKALKLGSEPNFSLGHDSSYLLNRSTSRSEISLSSEFHDPTDLNMVDEIQSAPPLCGIFLCLGMDDPNSLKADHSKSSMAESAKKIRQMLGAPLRVVLDLKSRRVPPRVWARLVDHLRSRGLCVDGLGSFSIDELRSIGSFCSTPITQVIFFHSAGDLQRACHAGEVKHGDTVFFNAGSLIWKKPTLCEASGLGWCATTSSALLDADFYENGPLEDDWRVDGLVFNGFTFQPYAYPQDKMESCSGFLPQCKSTLHAYQKHLSLNIGLYVQEFSIGPNELDALVKIVNAYPSVYNLGLAWGGINGGTVRGVHGDGFWNQRYIGRDWDVNAEPAEHMRLLGPEDHHMFQKAIHAGDWAQLATVNQIAIDPNEEEGPLVNGCK